MKTKSSKMSMKNITHVFMVFLIVFSVAFYVVFFNPESNRDEILVVTGVIASFLFLLSSNTFLLVPYKSLLNKILNIKSKNDREYIQKSFPEDLEPFKETINILLTEIHHATSLIRAIENGNSSSIESENIQLKDSILLNAIASMKGRMEEIAKEERNRNWTSEGIAKFSEILRNNQDNLTLLANNIIVNLCKYLNANQGGLFVYKDAEDQSGYLEMLSCYAYDRQKYLEKKITIGEGLLGQCYLEKEEIYMTELPTNYVSITSGLGNATPKYLLIVPLILNEQVYGVLEIASFYAIEKYQIEFVKKLAENIASTLSNAMVNQKTNKILSELQLQTMQMKEQEEELRQNMEEMKSIQEDMVRKERQINMLLDQSQTNEKLLAQKLDEIEEIKRKENENTQKLLNEMDYNHKVMLQVIDQLPEKIFLKDGEGKFLMLNNAIAQGYNKQVSELIGTSDFDHFTVEQATEYRNIELAMLDKNQPLTMYEDFVDANGDKRILYTVKMPFKFPKKSKLGILGYQVDVTDIKMLEKKVFEAEKKLIDKLNRE